MSVERVETLIAGGGQAGIAMSHQLSRRGCPHLVLERHRIAERWRTERWDGLRFQFPNWSVGFPGFPLPHTDPDEFATAAEIVDFINAYADAVAAPVRCGVALTALRQRDDAAGFLAQTSEGLIEAANVVVATGPYQRPVIPPLLPRECGIFQVHASGYRNPDQLPGGAVLVVGGGSSGAQIAEELMRAGRRVYLSVSKHRRRPRRYRGRDLTWWWTETGALNLPVEERGPDQSPMVFTGAYGGHTINFRRFASEGMVLLGRTEAAQNDVMFFAPDLLLSLSHGDAAYRSMLDSFDAYAVDAGLDLPEDVDARATEPDPPCVTEPIRQLNLHDSGIGAVIWATGYRLDFGWIDVPVLNEGGIPVHRAGVTAVPGLYFLGLHWLSRRASSMLVGEGVAGDAIYLANQIAARR
jgi:putative flavoprotein involved in K+ transport